MFKRNADTIILTSVAILVVLGLAMLASASSYLGASKFGDPYHFVKHQLTFGVGVGILGFAAGYFTPLRFLKSASLVLLLLNVALLIMVFTPLGGGFGTADRWVTLGGITFQPAEPLKFTFITYLAAWLTSRAKDRKSDVWEGLLPFLIIAGIIAGLLFLQPATSAVFILMGAALVVYFVHGVRLSYLAGIILLATLAFAAVVYATPYRMARVTAFLNPSADPQRTGYHVNQAITAIGSGGLFGVGYGRSSVKMNLLPEPIGDSIFAIIGEELGFLGAFLFILVFLTLVMAGYSGSTLVRTPFARLLLIGFSSLIALQVALHIGAVSGIAPLTGVPLPFVSFGSTALVTFLTMSGVMVNAVRKG